MPLISLKTSVTDDLLKGPAICIASSLDRPTTLVSITLLGVMAWGIDLFAKVEALISDPFLRTLLLKGIPLLGCIITILLICMALGVMVWTLLLMSRPVALGSILSRVPTEWCDCLIEQFRNSLFIRKNSTIVMVLGTLRTVTVFRAVTATRKPLLKTCFCKTPCFVAANMS